MSYRLKRRERIDRGIHRIGKALLTATLADLQRTTRDEAIHDARRQMKKLRALLRLAQSGIEPVVFDRENSEFRDIGLRLSLVRDADVLRDIVRKLRPGTPRDPGFRAVLRHLNRHRLSVRHEFFDDRQARLNLRKAVTDAQSRLKDWTRVAANDKTIFKGLRRSYRRARNAFDSSRGSEDDGRWHEWRKRTKDLWHHMRLVEPMWPSVMQPAIDDCKELSDTLGDDHDLVVFVHRLTELDPDKATVRECNRLRGLVARRRQTLHTKAIALGDHLLADKPRAFAARIKACWYVWRQ